jgi:hypothetical protein
VAAEHVVGGGEEHAHLSNKVGNFYLKKIKILFIDIIFTFK